MIHDKGYLVFYDWIEDHYKLIGYDFWPLEEKVEVQNDPWKYIFFAEHSFNVNILSNNIETTRFLIGLF